MCIAFSSQNKIKTDEKRKKTRKQSKSTDIQNNKKTNQIKYRSSAKWKSAFQASALDGGQVFVA